MTVARADDRIWWTPQLLTAGVFWRPYPAHVCPSAVLITVQTRETLDWMALGTCRYCGEALP